MTDFISDDIRNFFSLQRDHFNVEFFYVGVHHAHQDAKRLQHIVHTLQQCIKINLVLNAHASIQHSTNDPVINATKEISVAMPSNTVAAIDHEIFMIIHQKPQQFIKPHFIRRKQRRPITQKQTT